MAFPKASVPTPKRVIIDQIGLTTALGLVDEALAAGQIGIARDFLAQMKTQCNEGMWKLTVTPGFPASTTKLIEQKEKKGK